MEWGAAAGDDGDGPRERRGRDEAARPQQNHQVQPQPAADLCPKHSYWLDLWLFVLVDLALFVFVYLLPCLVVEDVASLAPAGIITMLFRMVCLVSKLRSWLLEWMDNDYSFLNKEDRQDCATEAFQTRKRTLLLLFTLLLTWGTILNG